MNAFSRRYAPLDDNEAAVIRTITSVFRARVSSVFYFEKNQCMTNSLRIKRRTVWNCFENNSKIVISQTQISI
jgi:hypothetical protein